MAQFNRTHDLTVLYDLVMQRTPIFLAAPDGMGKSFLLQQLISKLEQRRVCFYISMRGYLSFQQFIEDWIAEISRVAAGHNNLQYQFKRFLESNSPLRLQKIGEALEWCHHLSQMLAQVSLDFLFIFEDLEEWEAEAGDESIHQFFQSVGSARNAQLLFTANLSAFTKPDIPGITHYTLEPLAAESVWPEGPTAEQKLAYEYTGGHTGFLLHLTRYQANGDNFSAASEKLMQEIHPRFKLFKNRFTNLQWKLLMAIALEGSVEQPHAFNFLVHYKLGAASSVERALKNLSDSGVIQQRNKAWQLTQTIHERWLQWLYSSSFN